MTSPFSHPFLQREDTMYLSTICTFSIMQPNKIFQLGRPSIEKAHFFRRIFPGLLPRCISLRMRLLLISSFQLTWSLFLIEAKTLIKRRILFTLMISKEQGQNARSLGVIEKSILFVQSTYCPQRPR